MNMEVEEERSKEDRGRKGREERKRKEMSGNR